MSNENGFTLLEIIFVVGITILMTAFLVNRLSRTQVALDQGTAAIRALLREAQANALSGALYAGLARCGYGVHFTSSNYILYAGSTSGTTDCLTQDRNFDDFDTLVRFIPMPAGIEIVVPAPDIFFEPPNPTTYINGVKTPGTSVTITVRKTGQTCPGADCKTITVTAAGTIQSP